MTTRNLKRLIVALLAIVMVLGISAPVMAASNPRVTVQFDRSSVAIGETISCQYAISGGTKPYDTAGLIWEVYSEET